MVRLPRKHKEFDVLLEQDEEGIWAVSVPALPGRFSQGATRREALQSAKEAIALQLEGATPLQLQSVEIDRVRIEA